MSRFNKEEHLKSAVFISDVVMGMSGLTVPFAFTLGGVPVQLHF